MIDIDEQVAPRDGAVDATGTRSVLAWLMVVGGAIGLLASGILTYDKIKLLQNPESSLACTLNAWVDCGGVVSSSQSSIFGFPNTFLGLVGFAVVVTLGVLLLSDVRLPEWMWVGLQVGVVLAIALIFFLQFTSIFTLVKLCPYCMVVWSVTIPLFVAVSARNLRAWAPTSGFTKIVSDWSLLIVLLWYVAVASVIWFQFGPERLFAS
ncbi:vitamin K epoxide reductase family protein [Mumia zhuanghuii]|uniref:Vitamin K epoxide reductase family protein n=1 Tax=Mumia zhuanghuii TaxID=2585211 RepID=A0A5C4MQB8_9ACTN|nr:vitamin K epoxide reductase family protein [Mumia zhuanghuii]TNC47109.1 vitamin K epoxide reductase family protein [Mumia zhuanghuii]